MDIAIAGAGIAGLASATMLARAGHHVVVYDKAAEPAPVGSGLIIQPVGQAVLNEMGLLKAAQLAGAPLHRLWAENMSGRTVLDVRYEALGAGIHGLGIHRASLFDLLLEAALQAGARLQSGQEIVAVESDTASKLCLRFVRSVKSPSFDLVIDAMGVRSPLIDRDGELKFGALWANVPWPDSESFHPNRLTQRYAGADTSSGVMPIGKGTGENAQAAFFWTLRQRAYEDWCEGGIEKWKAEALDFWPALEPCLCHIHDTEQFAFARYAHDTWARPVEGRLLHLGDAWHAASPQLGQGANMALLDAFALAQAFERSTHIDEALAHFLEIRARHVKLYQAISWAFTPVYQSESKLLPALRDIFVQPVASIPVAQRLLAMMVAGKLGDVSKLFSL